MCESRARYDLRRFRVPVIALIQASGDNRADCRVRAETARWPHGLPARAPGRHVGSTNHRLVNAFILRQGFRKRTFS
jgi:hypothetical protein